MNLSMLHRHQRLISVVFACICFATSLSFGFGSLKYWREIAWLDVVGEGSIAFLTLLWTFFILASRPPGKVTNFLVCGLACFMFTALLDVFDEFTRYSSAFAYLSVIESLPATVGMLLMSYALYHWHQEQLVLNRQLKRRESYQREHEQVDMITQLYSADYMKGIISGQLNDGDKPFSVVMLDIDNFDAFNRQYGHNLGDRLLREISELIVMNLRTHDLACRYAGDRFVLLMPNTSLSEASELALQIKKSVQALAFKTDQQTTPVYQSLSYAASEGLKGDQVDSLLKRVNQRLDLSRT